MSLSVNQTSLIYLSGGTDAMVAQYRGDYDPVVFDTEDYFSLRMKRQAYLIEKKFGKKFLDRVHWWRGRSVSYNEPIEYTYSDDIYYLPPEALEEAGYGVWPDFHATPLPIQWVRMHPNYPWTREILSSIEGLTLADLQELDDPQKFPSVTGKWDLYYLGIRMKITMDDLPAISHYTSQQFWENSLSNNDWLDWTDILEMTQVDYETITGGLASDRDDFRVLIKIGHIHQDRELEWRSIKIMQLFANANWQNNFESLNLPNSWARDHRHIWRIGNFWRMQT